MVAIWGHLGIQKKIFAGLALILLLMAAMLAILIATNGLQGRLSDRLITRLLPARAAVRGIKRLIITADDEGAWYLLGDGASSRQQVLRAYRSDVAEIRQSLRQLQQQAQLPEERLIAAESRRWLRVYLSGNESAFSLAHRAHASQARAAYVASSYAPVIDALDAYENIIQNQINQTESRRAAVGVYASVSAAVLSAGAMGLAIVTATRLGGSLRRRLGAVSNALSDVVRNDLVQLDASFRNIAAGDFTAPRYVYARRPIEDTATDEPGLLAQSYNELIGGLSEMSHRIDHAVAEARRRVEAEERLAYLEQYDDVTGLANRRLLHVELDHALGAGDRSDDHLAVAYLGLLGFKKVEDSYGHAFAQRVLRFIATRLGGSLRETDLAARGGSDEFIVVLDPVGGRGDALDLTRRLVNALSRPFVLDGRELPVNVSAGVSLHPYDGHDADELLRNANTAMSYAKESGIGEVVLYASRLRARSIERLTLESDLQHALDQSEFEVYYQPIVNVPAGRIHSFEALVRWRHPRLGLLEPASFIDVAEDTGTIEKLGSWVLETACTQAQQWRSDGFDIGISVNVSIRQFRGDIFGNVEQALHRTHLPPQSLELELTETVLLTDRHSVSRTLGDLKHLGVRLAIDDFGTGYSSLAYLRTFPLDGLKIDRSFVSDITTKPYDQAIANTIILLGHSLGVRVIAEGVEDQEQAAVLRRLGCDAMQGYFFGKPVPAAACLPLLQTFASG